MVRALVLNKKYNFSKIIFHYMKIILLQVVEVGCIRDCADDVGSRVSESGEAEENDLMVLHHMDNETLIRLSKYTTNWPEPKTKTEFFGFIKDEKYEDPDPVNHLKWKNDAEMKEKSAADELTKLEDFSGTRNERFTKVEKEKKRGGRELRKFKQKKGSSSQSQKKRKKKAVETMLVDEPEEDEQKLTLK
ncbi:hypothetical protein HanPSC8_Chr00c245g0806831 [Helianthus annuus]|nr:hypothetical protein HanPSC8_Chr00c245g0806831 [Helianthus annuus]